jgi:hypothetical protein
MAGRRRHGIPYLTQFNRPPNLQQIGADHFRPPQTLVFAPFPLLLRQRFQRLFQLLYQLRRQRAQLSQYLVSPLRQQANRECRSGAHRHFLRAIPKRSRLFGSLHPMRRKKDTKKLNKILNVSVI